LNSNSGKLILRRGRRQKGITLVFVVIVVVVVVVVRVLVVFPPLMMKENTQKTKMGIDL